jgi:GTP-binding protein
MAFVDELTIHIKAGKGGDGVVRWRHEKGKEFGGPSGGDGGKGGDVYIEASRDLSLLFKYRHEKRFAAKDGGDGGKNLSHGANGDDLVLLLPIGSVVTNLSSKRSVQLLTDKERILLLSGGKGGFGNNHYKSSRNQRPMKATPGKPGEEADFHIELQLVADVGLVGFPNAGKSSLLNALTNADAKVGAYRFTTLEPNLGAFHGYVIADIPGLIEGASEGKGLGHKFLRHVKRTKMIVHLVSLENEDVLGAYKAIRAELDAFDHELAAKDEIILLTKTDMVDKETLDRARRALSKTKRPIFDITVLDKESVKRFADSLVKLLRARE